jgi:hypothetical protein
MRRNSTSTIGALHQFYSSSLFTVSLFVWHFLFAVLCISASMVTRNDIAQAEINEPMKEALPTQVVQRNDRAEIN